MKKIPYCYRAVVKGIVENGTSLIMDVDLGFDSYVQNQKFDLLGILPADDADTRRRAVEFLNNSVPVGSDVLVETFKTVDGEYQIEIVDKDDNGLARLLVVNGFAEFDEKIREKFGLPEIEE